MAHGQLIFVSGGVRSGKSAFAEAWIHSCESERNVYVASGMATDKEMAERIRQHRSDRSEGGWKTIEQPQRMHELISHLKKGDAVLWDCVTTWLANELYATHEGGVCADYPECMKQKWQELKQAIKIIRQHSNCLVIVSNEVLDEPLRAPSYQKWLGTIHQWLAGQADEAYEMENGLAIRRK